MKCGRTSRYVNRVFLLGRVVEDPVIRYLEKGGLVVEAVISTDSFVREANAEPSHHSVVFFGSAARIAERTLYAGNDIYLEGKLIAMSSHSLMGSMNTRQVAVFSRRGIWVMNVRPRKFFNSNSAH